MLDVHDAIIRQRVMEIERGNAELGINQVNIDFSLRVLPLPREERTALCRVGERRGEIDVRIGIDIGVAHVLRRQAYPRRELRREFSGRSARIPQAWSCPNNS